MSKVQKAATKQHAQKKSGQNANGVKRQKADTRNRYQYRFWLDANKDVELLMMENLDTMKRTRRFAKTLRDALRLFFSLLMGDLSVLEELFPAAVAAIYERGRADALQEVGISASTQFEAIMAKIDALHTDGVKVTPNIPRTERPITYDPLPLVALPDDDNETVFAISDDAVLSNFLSAFE